MVKTPVNMVNTNASPIGFPPHGLWLRSKFLLMGLYGGTPRWSSSQPGGFEAAGGEDRLPVFGGAGVALSLVRRTS